MGETAPKKIKSLPKYSGCLLHYIEAINYTAAEMKFIEHKNSEIFKKELALKQGFKHNAKQVKRGTERFLTKYENIMTYMKGKKYKEQKDVKTTLKDGLKPKPKSGDFVIMIENHKFKGKIAHFQIITSLKPKQNIKYDKFIEKYSHDTDNMNLLDDYLNNLSLKEKNKILYKD